MTRLWRRYQSFSGLLLGSLVLLFGHFALPAHAQVGCAVVGNYPSGPVPALYSGTSCIVVVHAGTVSGRWLTNMKLYIGGTLVRSSNYPSPGGPPAARMSVQFDSTHFPDGSPIHIKVQAWNNANEMGEAEVHVPAYNKGYDLINQTLTEIGETGAIVGLEMATANHTVLAANNHTKTTILTNLPTYTVFFVYTHGSPGRFGDCFATNDPANYLSAGEVQTAVAQKGGHAASVLVRAPSGLQRAGQ
jgi:hypothetical protein